MGSLLLIAISQGILLIAVGPLIKVIFGFSGDTLHIRDLFSTGLGSRIGTLGDVALRSQDLALIVPLAIVAAGAVKALGTYCFQFNQENLTLRLASEFRVRLFIAIVARPFAHFIRRSSAQWMSVIMNDVMFLQARFQDLAKAMLKDTVVLAASLVTATILDWRGGLILLALAPIVAFAMGRMGRRIGHFAERFQRRLAGMATHVLQMRARFEFIRAQGGESLELAQFARLNDDYYRAARRSIFVRSAFAPVLEFLGFAALSVFLWRSFGHGAPPPGSGETLMQFAAALGLMLQPLRNIGEQMSRWHETLGVLAVGQNLLADGGLPAIADLAACGEPGRDLALTGRVGHWPIRLDRVVAGFDDRPIITGSDLQLAPGKSIAVVGAIGRGKSTLIRTFAGLLAPLEWQATSVVDEFRRRVSYVSQAPFLFDGTVRENLIYGSSVPVSEAEMRQALRAVGMDGEIVDLDARTQRLAANFSGGQIQRLVVARALLRRCDVWALDEPTSAIDGVAEMNLMRYLIGCCTSENRALIAVTHRLNILPLFSEIWFVHDGQVLPGSQETLWQHGAYRQFYQAESHHGVADEHSRHTAT